MERQGPDTKFLIELGAPDSLVDLSDFDYLADSADLDDSDYIADLANLDDHDYLADGAARLHHG